jgi:hypothetical protein
MITIEDAPLWKQQDTQLCDPTTGRLVPGTCERPWVVIDKDGNFVEMISERKHMPSIVYKNVTPRDFVNSILLEAARAHEGQDGVMGDVSILCLKSCPKSGHLLVVIKCPQIFTLDSNPLDEFGLLLVGTNNYKQQRSFDVSAGAIRMICTNGCTFGANNISTIKWNHKTSEEDMITSRAKKVLEKSVEYAQIAMEEMKLVPLKHLLYVEDARAPLKWCATRALESCSGVAEMVILEMRSLTWYQRLVIVEAFHHHTKCAHFVTKYDLWNAFTWMASHNCGTANSKRPSGDAAKITNECYSLTIERLGRGNTSADETIVRQQLLLQIAAAFGKGGLVDKKLSLSPDDFVVAKNVLVAANQKNWPHKLKHGWPVYGPAYNLSMFKRTVEEGSIEVASTSPYDVSEMSDSDWESLGEDSEDVDSEDEGVLTSKRTRLE